MIYPISSFPISGACLVDKQQAIALQKHLFTLGYSWRQYGKDVKPGLFAASVSNCVYLFWDSSKIITYSPDFNGYKKDSRPLYDFTDLFKSISYAGKAEPVEVVSDCCGAKVLEEDENPQGGTVCGDCKEPCNKVSVGFEEMLNDTRPLTPYEEFVDFLTAEKGRQAYDKLAALKDLNPNYVTFFTWSLMAAKSAARENVAAALLKTKENDFNDGRLSSVAKAALEIYVTNKGDVSGLFGAAEEDVRRAAFRYQVYLLSEISYRWPQSYYDQSTVDEIRAINTKFI